RGAPLARGEDLLGHDPGVRTGFMAAAEVSLRVMEPVGVIDAYPVEHAGCEPTEDQCVRVGEDPLVLGPEPDERIDVEEAPIPEFSPRGAPEGQPVVLALEKGVERVRVGVYLGHGRIERRCDGRLLVAEAGEVLPDHFLIAVPLADCRLVRRRREGEPTEGSGEKRKFIPRAGLRRLAGAAPGAAR